MTAKEQGLRLNGTAQLIEEGVRALEALQDYLYARGNIYPAAENSDLSELRLYENLPVEAVISDDIGHAKIVWTGDAWEEVKA